MGSIHWRDRIKVHQAAELFPPLSDVEMQELRADIKAHGIRIPVFLIERRTDDALLIDGRSRLDAAEREGIELFDLDGTRKFPHRIFLEEELGDPDAFVLSVNLRRRHLTSEQRDEVIRRLKERRPDLSIRAIAQITKTPASTVARVAKKGAAGVPSGTASTPIATGKVVATSHRTGRQELPGRANAPLRSR
jgi:hypothetical protein